MKAISLAREHTLQSPQFQKTVPVHQQAPGPGDLRSGCMTSGVDALVDGLQPETLPPDGAPPDADGWPPEGDAAVEEPEPAVVRVCMNVSARAAASAIAAAVAWVGVMPALQEGIMQRTRHVTSTHRLAFGSAAHQSASLQYMVLTPLLELHPRCALP